MQELRYIFALLVASKRKYIDPSKAVDILKEVFSSEYIEQVEIIHAARTDRKLILCTDRGISVPYELKVCW